jgi:hypothetical protein
VRWSGNDYFSVSLEGLMGLDITAYSHLRALGRHTSEWCTEKEHIAVYAYGWFPESFRGIPVLDRDDELLHGGCYEMTAESSTYAFRAGSYTGYNLWRDQLRLQYNPETDPAGPFYELIWFADNEGSIGELAAAELLADFRAHEATYHAPEPWYRDKYVAWTGAFELATHGGLVRFH